MQLAALRQLVLDALTELKAIDVVEMDVSDLTSVTDLMIVCSGRSSRHVKSIADKVIEVTKAEKMPPLSVEGHDEGDWVLLDLADIVVHIMQPSIRDFYDLEKLWSVTAERQSS